MTSQNRLFDPGMQPERTALAWRRTSLALLVGSLAACRILPELLGAWALVLAGCGVVAAVLLVWMVHRRYDRHHAMLTAEGAPPRVPLAGGRLIGFMALFVFCAGLVSLLVVVVRML